MKKHKRIAIIFALVLLAAGALVYRHLAPEGFDVNGASWQHTLKMHNKASASQDMARESAAYEVLVERALMYRVITIEAADRLKAKMVEERPLSGADLDLLSQGTLAHLQLRQQLLDAAHAHESWLAGPWRPARHRTWAPVREGIV